MGRSGHDRFKRLRTLPGGLLRAYREVGNHRVTPDRAG